MEVKSTPKHVAIIMDGNGRWAQARGQERLEGHRRGAEVVRDITTYARELDIPYLTLYSFSVQNWCRPASEISGLMGLLEDYCVRERDTLMDNDIRLNTLGRLEALPQSTQDALSKLKEESAGNKSMVLSLALNYGGREELVWAMQDVAKKVAAGELSPEAIDEAVISQGLTTHDIPDPDLMIRTSGELRISNFLLWQAAYAEFYFTERFWPDFTRQDFDAALQDFARRCRRFGATLEQTSA